MRDFFKTIIISDIHLGTKVSKVKALNNFLKHHRCGHLIINGDLYGDKKSMRKEYWKKKHFKFFSRIQKMMDEDGTQVTIVRGVHDEVLQAGTPLLPDNIDVVSELILDRGPKKYYVIHGDLFGHSIYRKYPNLPLDGNIGKMMRWAGKFVPGIYPDPLHLGFAGLAQYALYLQVYEKYMVHLAENKGCTGVICGHSHQACVKEIAKMQYLNSGDWIDSLSALVEDENGQWNLCVNAASKTPSLGKKQQKIVTFYDDTNTLAVAK